MKDSFTFLNGLAIFSIVSDTTTIITGLVISLGSTSSLPCNIFSLTYQSTIPLSLDLSISQTLPDNLVTISYTC